MNPWALCTIDNQSLVNSVALSDGGNVNLSGDKSIDLCSKSLHIKTSNKASSEN